jgi:hypothetical protein
VRRGRSVGEIEIGKAKANDMGWKSDGRFGKQESRLSAKEVSTAARRVRSSPISTRKRRTAKPLHRKWTTACLSCPQGALHGTVPSAGLHDGNTNKCLNFRR